MAAPAAALKAGKSQEREVPRRRWPLRVRIVLLTLLLLLAVLTALWGYYERMLAEVVEQYIGQSALDVAKAVAQIPSIRDAFDDPDPAVAIQPIAEAIRSATGAEFVVVGNTDSIRYSHPLPERLGKHMVGGDNGPALEEGKSYVSKAVGTLGPSLRGKTPVFDNEGDIIGIVSVGFLQQDIREIIGRYRLRLTLLTMMVLLLGMAGAFVLANNIKREILSLEPDEIANLLLERTAIVESIREGVIAINSAGVVTMANPAAQCLMGCQPVGRQIAEVLPNTGMLRVLETGKAEFDQEMLMDDDVVVVNRVPLFDGGRAVGVVSSFRSKTEIDRLSRELSHTRQFTEELRSQAHEFANKLNTISGLLQLGRHQEAEEYIGEVTSREQDLIQFLQRQLRDPMLAGVLLGKITQAAEARVTLQIDRGSSLNTLPPEMDREALVTILGNLLQNAIEAVQNQPEEERRVEVFLTDLGQDVIIEVEDTGPGIAEADRDRIFEENFTTKSGNGKVRGLGLALVRRAVDRLGGSITAENSDKGALFTAVIPKVLEVMG